jgi:cation diffusion facilitator family transporter
MESSPAPGLWKSTSLERFAWLSIAAALATIALKTLAWRLTGSVGLLSDALESLVNLVAAVLALSMLRLAATPPDDDYPHGLSKAEYLSAGIEGALIVLAAAGILFTAIPRLLHPNRSTHRSSASASASSLRSSTSARRWS